MSKIWWVFLIFVLIIANIWLYKYHEEKKNFAPDNSNSTISEQPDLDEIENNFIIIVIVVVALVIIFGIFSLLNKNP